MVRIDASSIAVTFLPMPKGKKRGSAVGFCGASPVASVQAAGNSAPPHVWRDGKPAIFGYQDMKKVVACGTSQAQVAGYWLSAKDDARALVWSRDGDALAGVELHPPKWDKTSAMACGDGQQVGFGYEKFAKQPARALLWSGDRDSLVVLTGPDAARDAYANGVGGGMQVGRVGVGPQVVHACLWRGSSQTFTDLHPAGDFLGSEIHGVRDGEQVGIVYDAESMLMQAALWKGTPDSFVSLVPRGFKQSCASRCGHGFQVGWVSKQDRGMLRSAALWAGSGDDYVDLQTLLPAPWTASWATDLHAEGDTLRILGCAQQAVKQGGYEVNAGQLPVIWEIKLRDAVAARPREASRPVGKVVAAEALGSERLVEQCADAFATALVNGDYEAAHALLAPWLKKQVTAKTLQAIVKQQLIDGVEPVDHQVSANDSTLDELRASYAEHYKGDPDRILGKVDDFGMWGPPSLVIDDALTPENFRQWTLIELVPDAEGGSGLDYCLRLWLIVAELEGRMVIGYLEPGD